MKFRKKHLLSYIFISGLILAFLLNFSVLKQFSAFEGSVINGESSQNYEQYFDNNQFHHNESISFWKKIKYHFFKEGLEGIIVVTHSWLLTNQEFSYDDNRFFENKEYIRDIIASLKSQNIEVLILPIPSKARLYQEYLKKPYPAYLSNIYDDFLSFLKEEQVKTIDLLSLFENKDPLFFKTDTHWKPEATKLVAEKIRESGYIPIGKVTFKAIKPENEEFEGDLLKYVDSESYDLENVEVFDVVSSRQNYSLFSTQYFPVVLVGTSYSANKKWGLENYLKMILRQDILNVSDEGLGPFKVMENYMKILSDMKSRPQTIIWEIPERYLVN